MKRGEVILREIHILAKQIGSLQKLSASLPSSFGFVPLKTNSLVFMENYGGPDQGIVYVKIQTSTVVICEKFLKKARRLLNRKHILCERYYKNFPVWHP